MHMYTLRFVIDLKTYHLHAPVPVSTTLSFPASLTVKHLITKISVTKNLVISILKFFSFLFQN